MKKDLMYILAGALIVAVSWAPSLLWLNTTQNLHTIPMAFGLLLAAGSLLGGVTCLAGSFNLVIHALQALGTRLRGR
jgi:hypothetical protein